MDITCITLQDWWFGKGWKMQIDLQEVANCAGKRTRDEEGTYTPYPLTRAKKLLRLIRRYGTEEDFLACDRTFRTNPKLYEYWRSIR